MPTPTNMKNPIPGNRIANGTLMYDSTADCAKIFRRTTNSLSDCLAFQKLDPIISTLVCQSFQDETAPKVLAGQPFSLSGQFIIYYGGNGASYISQSFSSTGVTGLTLTINSGLLNTGNGTLGVSISGIPSSAGTASFSVNFGGSSCSFTINVSAQLTPDIKVSGLKCTPHLINISTVDGYIYPLPNNSVTYTGGNGASYSQKFIGQETWFDISTSYSLDLEIPNGTLANNNTNSIPLSVTRYGYVGPPGVTQEITVNFGGQSCDLRVVTYQSDRNKVTPNKFEQHENK